MVARIWPIAEIINVAVFDWVVVDVVESCPETVFIADACVPIVIPDFWPRFPSQLLMMNDVPPWNF